MGGYAEQLIVDAAIFVVLVVGLGVTFGHAGILSLCHAAFFGAGAYAAALACGLLPEAPWPVAVAFSLVVGILAGCLSSALVAVVCLGLRGDFVALATLAFGELARALALNFDWLGGARGIRNIPALTTPGLAVGLAVLSIAAARFLLQSPWGRMMEAARENADWADSLAIPRQRARLAAFVFGGALAGMAGALFAHHQQFVHPNSFGIMASITVLLAVILGGRGNLTGCLLGALGVFLFPEALRFTFASAEWRTLGIGLLLLVTACFWPHGMLGGWPYRDLLRRALQPVPGSSSEMDFGPERRSKNGNLVVKAFEVVAGEATILENVAMVAEPGVPLALVGPNGSGKSTLARALAGDIPAKGYIVLGGKCVGKSPRPLAERRTILRIPQHPTGFPRLTALDNVRLVIDRRFRCPSWLSWLPQIAAGANAGSWMAAMEALSWVGLADRANVLFEQLSYGQRKRVLLSAGLLADPCVLIVDEPFAGLNAQPGGEAETTVESLHRRLSSNERITVLIDHRVDLLKPICRAMALIDSGQILTQGAFDTVLDSALFRETYEGTRA